MLTSFFFFLLMLTLITLYGGILYVAREQETEKDHMSVSGINLTDEQQQTLQLSNSASARNVMERNGTDVARWLLEVGHSDVRDFEQLG